MNVRRERSGRDRLPLRADAVEAVEPRSSAELLEELTGLGEHRLVARQLAVLEQGHREPEGHAQLPEAPGGVLVPGHVPCQAGSETSRLRVEVRRTRAGRD